MTLLQHYQHEKLLKTMNTLGKNVTKDSVILYCMKEELYLISDEPNFRITFKSMKNDIKIIVYYNQNDNRYISINEAKEVII